MKNLWLKIFFVGILLFSCSAMIFREYVEMLYDDLVRSFMNRPKTSVSATLPTSHFNNLPTLMDYDNLPSAAALPPSDRGNTWSLVSPLSGNLHASSDVTTHSYGGGYVAVQPLPARQAVGNSVLYSHACSVSYEQPYHPVCGFACRGWGHHSCHEEDYDCRFGFESRLRSRGSFQDSARRRSPVAAPLAPLLPPHGTR